MTTKQEKKMEVRGWRDLRKGLLPWKPLHGLPRSAGGL